jgi:hypothetical protein
MDGQAPTATHVSLSDILTPLLDVFDSFLLWRMRKRLLRLTGSLSVLEWVVWLALLWFVIRELMKLFDAMFRSRRQFRVPSNLLDTV